MSEEQRRLRSAVPRALESGRSDQHSRLLLWQAVAAPSQVGAVNAPKPQLAGRQSGGSQVMLPDDAPAMGQVTPVP